MDRRHLGATQRAGEPDKDQAAVAQAAGRRSLWIGASTWRTIVAAPLRAAAPPYRPQPGRGRGRPRLLAVEDEDAPPVPAALPERPLTLVERRAFDTSDLEAALAFADTTLRRTRHRLDTLRGAPPPVPPDPVPQTPAARPDRGLGEPA